MKSKYLNAMALVFAIVLAFAYTSGAQTPNSQTKSSNSKDTTVTVKVTGITCSEDLKMISGSVEKLSGVSSFKQVGKMSTTSTFEVKYDPAKVSYQEMVKAVEGTASCDYPDQKPYKVKKVKVKD